MATLEIVLTAAAVLLPLTLAALMMPRPTRGVASWVALWATLPALLLALLPPSIVEVRWLQLGTVLGVTPTTRPLLVVTTLLWLAATHYAASYLADDPRRARFMTFFMLTLTGNLGLLLARDIASFYLFFALMTFAAYGLVVHSATAGAYRAGRIYIVMAVIGEALLLPALLLAAHAANSVLIGAAPAAVAASENRDVIVALLLAGFGVKAGLLGLHMWLPLAHPIAPTPASAVLSGAMIKAGLLGWLLFIAPDPAFAAWMVPLAAWGLIASFYGVAVGLMQDDPKAMLAYSSVSQMGLMLVALALGFAGQHSPSAAQVAIFYAGHHGLAKAALFLGVGAIAATAVTSTKRTALLMLLAVPAVALVGAPWTSGAAAKALLEAQVAPGMAPLWIKPGLTVAAVGTGLLMLRVLWAMRWMPQSSSGLQASMMASLVGLVALSALAAVMLAWVVVVSTPPADVMAAVPLAAALLIALLVIWRYRQTRWAQWRVPPGDVLMLVQFRDAQRGLHAIVGASAATVAAIWSALVRRERRLRRRWTVEIGREERVFPLAAGMLVVTTMVTLLALLAAG